MQGSSCIQHVFMHYRGVYFSKIYAPYGQAYKKGILHFFNLAVHFSKGTGIKHTKTEEYTPLYACTTLLMLFNACTLLVIFYFAYPKAQLPSS